MKIWYSPCRTGYDTTITKIDDNSFRYVGKVAINNVFVDFDDIFEFDIDSVVFPDIATQTNNIIQEAHRTDGELYIKVFRGYDSNISWDTGTYQVVV